MKKIIKNAIQCKKCGEIIESKSRHDYVQCKCGSCAVDGQNCGQARFGGIWMLSGNRESDSAKILFLPLLYHTLKE